jgi:hypothetical protein
LYKTVDGELVQVELEEIRRECPDLAKYFERGSTDIESLDTSTAIAIKPLYCDWSHAASRLLKSLEKHKDAKLFLFPVRPVHD